jgi:hypothetical protein
MITQNDPVHPGLGSHDSVLQIEPSVNNVPAAEPLGASCAYLPTLNTLEQDRHFGDLLKVR